MFFNSGTAQTIHSSVTGELVSVCLNCVWDADREVYDAFPLEEGSDWFGVAGELANQEAGTEAERAVIWRHGHLKIS